MEEIWRDVVGWEDRYKVSNTGKVYSKINNLVKKTAYTNDGHEVIMLSKDGKQFGTFVHRLVANAFIPNPDNLPIINHKDENPANNNVDNLEWCTYQYNNTYNDINIKNAKKSGYIVYQYNSNGDLVSEYYSCKNAAKILGVRDSNINACCNDKLFTAYGSVFSYKPLSKEEVLRRFELSNSSEFGKKNNVCSKAVNQFDLQMNFIASYQSTREAGRMLGISSSLVAGVCRGDHKSTHGFIFQYVN